MLFKDILDIKYRELSPLFDDLFELAKEKQSHSGDLLLVNENAALSRGQSDDDPPLDQFFYELGHNEEGQSERTNFEFIGEYVKDVHRNYSEYKKFYLESSSDSKFKQSLDHEIAFTMQFEMLIYLKI